LRWARPAVTNTPVGRDHGERLEMQIASMLTDNHIASPECALCRAN